MTDMTHQLSHEQFLQAMFVPMIASKVFGTGWEIEIRRNGEMIGKRRRRSPLWSDASVLLPDDTFAMLRKGLAAVDADFMPTTMPDSGEYRYMTYRVATRIRHITYVVGVSDDFDKRSEFEHVWSLLTQLASEVGF